MAVGIVLVLLGVCYPASSARAGGAVFRTRPRFVEPGQLVSIRVSFSRVSAGTGGVSAGPYEVYLQRMRGHSGSGEVMGPEFHVGRLQVVDSPRWGLVAYARFLAPRDAGAGRYVINHRNAAGQSLEEITWGSVVIDPHPDAARVRFHTEWRLQRMRHDLAERVRDLNNHVRHLVGSVVGGIGRAQPVGPAGESPLR